MRRLAPNHHAQNVARANETRKTLLRLGGIFVAIVVLNLFWP
jgi:hypothetical protein